ncbi:hypothetical protein MAPG_04528 [Magnaporthiopsis poae ATCC 64411]|uniref:Uncharacterized protein n=1 Tax=Magnaporthiopsis poae (strain ATCC 64411 / 73-15) TaxID=644358 RepID=A0A0C4DWZ3_MAGP6|nr:hypothetical protein MAPG_04528 [Magnaporthiopsis poae ATCC 64411]
MSLLKRILLVASMAAAATLASPLASRADTQRLEKRQGAGSPMCARPGVFCTQQDCGHLSPGYSPGVPPPSPTSTVDVVPTSPTTLVPLPYPSGGNDGDDDGDDGLVACGKNKCAKGNYCCNHSCGICAPAGGACIQLFCVDGELPGSD